MMSFMSTLFNFFTYFSIIFKSEEVTILLVMIMIYLLSE